MKKPLINNILWRNPDSRPRPAKHAWSGVVLHHTGNPPRKDVCWGEWFVRMARWLSTDDDVYVSAHYIISRDGLIDQLVDPKTHIAWHAGRSSFWNPETRTWASRCNDFMVGVELLGDGNIEPFTEHQYRAAAELCAWLQHEFLVPDNMIVGHEMVSPGRKVDPGKFFNWTIFFNIKQGVRR